MIREMGIKIRIERQFFSTPKELTQTQNDVKFDIILFCDIILYNLSDNITNKTNNI